MAICAKQFQAENKLSKNILVTTVMSNMGLFIAMDAEKIDTVKTKVGDRYVLEEMVKCGYKLGGEQSGHVIFLDYNTTGDGLVTALQLSAIVNKTGKTLSELAGIMKQLPQVLANAVVPNEKKNIYLEDAQIVKEIKKIEEKLNGRGRVLIRPSGTEPLVRVMLEGENQVELDELAHGLAKLIEEKSK